MMETKTLIFNGKDTGMKLESGAILHNTVISLIELHGKPLYNKLIEKGVKFKSPLKEFLEKEFNS